MQAVPVSKLVTLAAVSHDYFSDLTSFKQANASTTEKPIRKPVVDSGNNGKTK